MILDNNLQARDSKIIIAWEFLVRTKFTMFILIVWPQFFTALPRWVATSTGTEDMQGFLHFGQCNPLHSYTQRDTEIRETREFQFLQTQVSIFIFQDSSRKCRESLDVSGFCKSFFPNVLEAIHHISSTSCWIRFYNMELLASETVPKIGDRSTSYETHTSLSFTNVCRTTCSTQHGFDEAKSPTSSFSRNPCAIHLTNTRFLKLSLLPQRLAIKLRRIV